jgi:hypothetical protein
MKTKEATGASSAGGANKKRTEKATGTATADAANDKKQKQSPSASYREKMAALKE